MQLWPLAILSRTASCPSFLRGELFYPAMFDHLAKYEKCTKLLRTALFHSVFSVSSVVKKLSRTAFVIPLCPLWKNISSARLVSRAVAEVGCRREDHVRRAIESCFRRVLNHADHEADRDDLHRHFVAEPKQATG